MEALEQDPILTFHPGTLEAIRKIYNLDKSEVMADLIDILDAWVKEQPHFVKKDFSRGYLERLIIKAKGSVERAQSILDRNCTVRTVFPQYFISHNIGDTELNQITTSLIMPKLTKDYYRVLILENRGQQFNQQIWIDFFGHWCYLLEYASAHDYALGVIVIYDYRKTNLMEFIKSTIKANVVMDFFKIFLNSYGLRVKALHVITDSKLINTMLSIIKPLMPAKIANRVYVHNELDSLYEHVEKEILPMEYGGDEMSMYEIGDEWLDVISTEEFKAYIADMNAAKTDESLRPKDGNNYEFLGPIIRTFRCLNMD